MSNSQSSMIRVIVLAVVGLAVLGGAFMYVRSHQSSVFKQEADDVLARSVEFLHETDGYQDNEALFDSMVADCDKDARASAGNDTDAYEKAFLTCLVGKLKDGGFAEQSRRFNIRLMSLE